jgi:hypothetical protein
MKDGQVHFRYSGLKTLTRTKSMRYKTTYKNLQSFTGLPLSFKILKSRDCKLSNIGSHIIKVKKENHDILEVRNQNQGANDSQTSINL